MITSAARDSPPLLKLRRVVLSLSASHEDAKVQVRVLACAVHGSSYSWSQSRFWAHRDRERSPFLHAGNSQGSRKLGFDGSVVGQEDSEGPRLASGASLAQQDDGQSDHQVGALELGSPTRPSEEEGGGLQAGLQSQL